ncbi:hypothetical protein E8E13_011096 [Curvularia kusanoi]|uniref:Uncharacterized protein n=1 Tax=Curvularia kusanoi TaxID=90978 RepID=A0A9P4WB64_CURKU|nr:hypothetical protein E8E13_011096 [Curvularia kusanoi]
MAHDEPSVRSALVALGHLNKSQKGSLQHARQYSVAAKTPERKPFLLNYNKAIRQLINDMARPSFPPEQGLVICLLFACIEFLQADAAVAFTHIRSGLNIFHELRQRRQLTPGSKSLQEAHGHIIPARLNSIEQILVQILTWSLASAMPYGMYLKTDFEYLKSCPKHFAGTTFASLADVRSSFSDIRNAAILLARDLGIEVYGPEELTLFARERQNSLLSSHRTWLEALTSLESSRTWSKDEMTTLSAIKVEYYSSFTACSCLTDWTQMTFDAHLADFQSILVHARHVVDSLSLPNCHTQSKAIGAAAHFTFVTSFVPAMFNFAIRCRCPVTRREAVKILASDIPREGLWDPAQYRKVAERVIEIEESEVDDRGWPTQASRLCRSTPGPEIDEFGGFQVEFQYANDWATSNKHSWSERLELDTGHEQPLALRLQDAKAPHPQQP